MNIYILTVSNEEIKTRKGFTGADWWWDDKGDLQVRVARELEDWRERMALAIHEASEALMSKHLDITVEMVDKFDALHTEEEMDPSFNSGDQPGAPYRIPHTFATAIERILVGVFGVDWKGYDERLSKL